MQLTIANISTKVSDADLQAAVAAIGRQVQEHFQPEWGGSSTLSGVTTPLPSPGQAPIDADTDAIIYLGDSAEDPTTGVSGALGYHSDNQKGIPYGFVYLDVCAQYGENWTTTLSHEVLELLGDPDAAMTVSGPAPHHKRGFVHYDLEVADPTQGDSYTIDGVVVSNFVGKAWFGMSGGSGTTNYLKLTLAPFAVRPGGYLQYEDGRGAHQIFGEKVTDKQKAAKRMLKEGRRNARRAHRPPAE
jgi:hypothetical protein